MSFIPMGGYKPTRIMLLQKQETKITTGNGFNSRNSCTFKVSRDQDEFASLSYESLKAQAEGDKQIVPITVDQTFVNEKGKKKLNLVVNKMKALEQGTLKKF
jgi:acetyl-CoA acyltransferase